MKPFRQKVILWHREAPLFLRVFDDKVEFSASLHQSSVPRPSQVILIC